MVHPQVGETVPDEQVEPAIVGADVVQSKADKEQTKIGQGNQLGVTSLIERAGGVEVVDTAEPAVGLALAAALGLLLVVVVAGDVDQEVHGPAEELLQDQVAGSQDRGLLHELAELVDGLADTGSVLITGLGNEDHVASKVTGSLVVLAVGDLPREVGDQQERVADPADGVVQDLGGREGLVTTLVGQDPNTGTDETLDDGIQSPEDDTGRKAGNSLRGDIVVEEVEDGGQNEHVPEDIVQTGDSRAVEAVSGNGIANLLDGEVGDLELIAIGVDHLGVSGFRGHGGQGSRRRRLTRTIEWRGRDRGNRRVRGLVAVQRNALRNSGGRHG